ncbi:hypothetical protein PIB30_027875 [Stylosanthes scabra]|uniref:Uncharacterized protein n=1 Tax=Stylosanthes scabra TaxID=79078 RepID=A0ABU6WAR8_9FABA|nr:hypothetical protein [Stylosanthes scabra]
MFSSMTTNTSTAADLTQNQSTQVIPIIHGKTQVAQHSTMTSKNSVSAEESPKDTTPLPSTDSEQSSPNVPITAPVLITGIEVVLPAPLNQELTHQNPTTQTRQKISKLKPTSYLYVSHTDPELKYSIPKSVNQALKTLHWKNAIDKEYNALIKNQFVNFIKPFMA